MSENRTDLRRLNVYIASTVCGAALSAVVLLSSAWLMNALQMPLSFAAFLALMSLGSGCMLSGFICGKIKKHNGLRHGFICGVILLSLCMLGALIFGTVSGIDALAKTLTSVITGCTGGVLGVNSRRIN